MKKVTVNGHDHELSPDSPRATSHSALLQDLVTAVNELEDGETMSGIELASTAAADNVISSASEDASSTVAATTFHNTFANAANELEFNFTDSGNVSLLKIDNEGDVTSPGTVTAANVTATSAVTGATVVGTSTVSSPGISLGTHVTPVANNTSYLGDATHKFIRGYVSYTRDENEVNRIGLPYGTNGVNTYLSDDTHTANSSQHVFGTAAGVADAANGQKLAKFENYYHAMSYVTPSGAFKGGVEAQGGVSVAPLATPVNGTHTTAVTTGGTLLGNTAYYYRVSAINALGETLASTETSVTTTAGTNTNQVYVVWVPVVGAVGYKIYGRGTGAEQLLYTLTEPVSGSYHSGTEWHWLDNGSLTPSGALPALNTTGGLALTGTALNFITSGTTTTGAGLAGLTFKNTAAQTNDEFQFQSSAGTKLLRVDISGNAFIRGDLYSGNSIQMSQTDLGRAVIESAASDANVTSALASMTFKSTFAHTAGDLEFDFRDNAASLMALDNRGVLKLQNTDDSGTTGSRTVNKASGINAFAGGATAITITNDRCTSATCIVQAVLQTNDTTAILKNVVPTTGSFTINLTAAATGTTKVAWWIINS